MTPPVWYRAAMEMKPLLLRKDEANPLAPRRGVRGRSQMAEVQTCDLLIRDACVVTLDPGRRILARGEVPFLQAYAGNMAAIRLYAKLGFEHRCSVAVMVLRLA